MNPIAKMFNLCRIPTLTPGRMIFAILVAVIADGLQMLLGPFGWFAADQIIDLIAMLLTVAAIGFHIFLLPTFVLELFPLVNVLPTWTGCVLAVIAWRKRMQSPSPWPTIPATPPKVTDVEAPHPSPEDQTSERSN